MKALIIGIGGTGAQCVGHIRAQLLDALEPQEAPQLFDFASEGSDPYVVALSVEKAILDARLSYSLPLMEINSDLDKVTIREILANPDCLYQMSPRNFEIFTGELLRGLGYKVAVTKSSHDGGVDVYAEKMIDTMVHRYAIQCKHKKKAGKVGISFIRELLGTLTDKPVIAAILVTTGSFSASALKFIKRHGYRLFAWSFNDLMHLMKEYLRRALAGILQPEVQRT